MSVDNERKKSSTDGVVSSSHVADIITIDDNDNNIQAQDMTRNNYS